MESLADDGNAVESLAGTGYGKSALRMSTGCAMGPIGQQKGFTVGGNLKRRKNLPVRKEQ
ncbi:hypothetical protein RvY_05145 [Ramazzottius varieornatus]|uniref:Uncharacterized protein n=1 Tax=Ramazzottius varieornatus TaxID=947166 RepID=A0A1D1UXL7_RAMVA|nr:hypothetical protein RvY_05145 [Ramazzottius varieornatus]